MKTHDLPTFERQWAETQALLGDRLALYQVHSPTPDSPLWDDEALLHRLGRTAGCRPTRPSAPRPPQRGSAPMRWRWVRPWPSRGVDVVPSGAVTPQLRSNAAARDTDVDLPPLAEDPDQYWRTRGELPWA